MITTGTITVQRGLAKDNWYVLQDGKVLGLISYVQRDASLDGDMSQVSGTIPTMAYRKARSLIKDEISSENYIGLSNAIMGFGL